MGRQYGGLMKSELVAEYGMITDALIKRGYTIEQIRAQGHDVPAFMPQRMKEITRGMAETTGFSEDDIWVIYDGPIFYLTTPAMPAGCSFLAT